MKLILILCSTCDFLVVVCDYQVLFLSKRNKSVPSMRHALVENSCGVNVSVMLEPYAFEQYQQTQRRFCNVVETFRKCFGNVTILCYCCVILSIRFRHYHNVHKLRYFETFLSRSRSTQSFKRY